MILIRRLCALVAALALAGAAHANAGQHVEVIDALSDQLGKRYIFPDKAKAAMDTIRAQASAGDYAAAGDGDAFAALLTAQLQKSTGDLHLRVGYRAMPIPEMAPPEPPKAPAKPAQAFEAADCKPGKIRYYFAGSTECLAGGIGYFNVYGFSKDAGDAIDAAMTRLADASALIIDVRGNEGGDPAMVARLASYLFDERTHLNDIYWRGSNRTQEFWTSEMVAGRKFGSKKDVYVLVGGRTFSAGEELPYDLQALKRATVVGATTRGGANPGGPVRLTAHFGAFIPYGRAISPVTGGNWEGVGVIPDVAVPEDKALIVAQILALTKLAGSEPRAARKAQLRARLARLEREKDE